MKGCRSDTSPIGGHWRQPLGTGSCARSAKGGSGGQQHTLLAATAPLHLQTRAQQRAQQRARRCVTPPFRPAASLPPCRRLPDGATLLLCIAPTHKDPPIAALALGLHLAGLPGHPRPVAATLYDSAPPVSCLYCAMAEEEGYGNDLKCDLAARSHPGGRGKSLLIPSAPKARASTSHTPECTACAPTSTGLAALSRPRRHPVPMAHSQLLLLLVFCGLAAALSDKVRAVRERPACSAAACLRKAATAAAPRTSPLTGAPLLPLPGCHLPGRHLL